MHESALQQDVANLLTIIHLILAPYTVMDKWQNQRELCRFLVQAFGEYIHLNVILLPGIVRSEVNNPIRCSVED